MLTLLKYWFRNANQQETGALLDNRKPVEKELDVNFKDIVASANSVIWASRAYRKFPKKDQRQTLMCGAFALAKALGIMYSTKYGSYVDFSEAHIYQRRLNKPDGGMMMWDMFRIAQEGVTLGQLTPKELYTDFDADNLLVENFKADVGKVFSIGGGVYIDKPDIETIASVIQTTGKGVILLTYFLSGEWSREYPLIINPLLGAYDPSALRHFVVATDYGLESAGKILTIEDSAGFGGFFDRKLTADWIGKRVVMAGYPMNFKFTVAQIKPTYDGVTIVSAQKCLQAEGLFPTNVAFFEAIGPTTKISLEAFQKKYGLPVTRTLDKETKDILHKLFP